MSRRWTPRAFLRLFGWGLLVATGVFSEPTIAERPRVLVLTDIGNEPDDAQSLTRFLLYTNEFDIEGLVATTSNWQKTIVSPEKIRARVEAYGKVRDNLLVHAKGYPEAGRLLELTKSGRADFGMEGVGEGKDTEGSEWIIQVVDKPDPRPVWVTVWGGAVDLAQALWKVNKTRTAAEVYAFVSKLRVYTISDQDDTGAWMRRTFKDLFYIVSIHAYSRYHLSTWCGISGDKFYNFRGPDFSLVSNEWLDQHVRNGHGPMGELYPWTEFIMEGDTPSFLYLIPNGLGVSERPEYGSWGGRYERAVATDGLYTDTIDTVQGLDGLSYTNNQATVWRWREAYQHDFAARMDWTVAGSFEKANHNPVVVLNGKAGKEPVAWKVRVGETVKLSAEGSTDPDGDKLSYHWFHYKEPSGRVPDLTFSASTAETTGFVAPETRLATDFHVILSVKDSGTPSLYAYRRAVVTVEPQ